MILSLPPMKVCWCNFLRLPFLVYIITSSLSFQQQQHHGVTGLSVSAPIISSSSPLSTSNSFFLPSAVIGSSAINAAGRVRKSSLKKPRTSCLLHSRPPTDEDEPFLSSFFPAFEIGKISFFPYTPVLLLSLTVLLKSIAIINPGEVGVVSNLGKISQVDPGIHLVSPLSRVIPFTTKTQLLDLENVVPTKEGLTVELDTSVLYRITPNSAKDIYATIGSEYEKTIVIPEVSSVVRGLTSESDAKALYSGGGRNLIQNALKENLSERLEGRGIVIEDVLLKNLKLPTELTNSIELKAKAEQDSSRMEFVLAKERQEAERKAVEAQGIADFQRIVSDGISPNLLKWKGIEATEKLANSVNSKVVIIGSGKDGLPIILGNGENTK